LSDVAVRALGAGDADYWDEQIQRFENVHPFNVYDWGRVREIDGWAAVHLVAERGGEFCGGFLLLMKRLPLLPYRIFYGPQGPICHPDDDTTIRAFHRKVQEIAVNKRAIFLRVDPNLREDDSTGFVQTAASLNYIHLDQRWTFWNSPRDEYRISLDEYPTVDVLHNALDRDTRRCIRKGPKDGLINEVATSEQDLRAFYEIFKDFAVDRGFMARGYEYQKQLWECFPARCRGRLFLVKFEGRTIGGLICILFGRKCVAMHMGTPYKYQKLQTYYAYVWESIKWAKENDCVWYSFRGVGTTPAQEAFKRKFNPKVVALAGYFDYPFKPLLYRLFYWVEFTLLPASWPLLVGGRRILNRLTKPLSGRPVTGHD